MRSSFVTVLLAAAAILIGCGGADESRSRRVVLISIDTLRADGLGVYGSGVDSSPNLDRLAAQGVRFANAFAPSPLTAPSHATMLTGLHPISHGVLVNSHGSLAPEVETLAERLQSTGWRTGAIVASGILASQYGMDQGFDSYDDRLFSNMLAANRGELLPQARADAVTDAALSWLDQRIPDESWFLFLHYIDPHAPYEAPEPHATRFDELPFPRSSYLGEISYTDAQIGRLLDRLERDGFWRDGLLIVTSDHGEGLGEHGVATHEHFLYDGVLRIPLIARGPGLEGGRVVQAPVGLLDVAPTVRAYARLEADRALPGRPLGDSLPEDRAVVSVSYAPALVYDWSPLWLRSTRDERLIHSPRPEYYRVDSDPGELDNLVEREPERVAQLAAELRAEMEAYAAQRIDAAPLAVDDAMQGQLEALGYAISSGGLVDREWDDLSGSDLKDRREVLGLVLEYMNLRISDRPEEALAALDRIRELDPGNPFPDDSMPGIYALLGRDEELIAFVEARPPHLAQRPQEAYHRARALVRVGRVDEGIAALRENLARAPWHHVSRFELALALANEGRDDEAEAEYRALVERDPRNGVALNNLAMLVSGSAPETEVRALLERAVSADPDYPRARMNLGIALARAGEREPAIEQLEKFLWLDRSGEGRARVERMVMALKAQRE